MTRGDHPSPPSDNDADERPVRKQLKETSIESAPKNYNYDSNAAASANNKGSGRKRTLEESRDAADNTNENGDNRKKRSRESSLESSKKSEPAESKDAGADTQNVSDSHINTPTLASPKDSDSDSDSAKEGSHTPSRKSQEPEEQHEDLPDFNWVEELEAREKLIEWREQQLKEYESQLPDLNWIEARERLLVEREQQLKELEKHLAKVAEKRQKKKELWYQEELKRLEAREDQVMAQEVELVAWETELVVRKKEVDALRKQHDILKDELDRREAKATARELDLKIREKTVITRVLRCDACDNELEWWEIKLEEAPRSEETPSAEKISTPEETADSEEICKPKKTSAPEISESEEESKPVETSESKVSDNESDKVDNIKPHIQETSATPAATMTSNERPIQAPQKKRSREQLEQKDPAPAAPSEGEPEKKKHRDSSQERDAKTDKVGSPTSIFDFLTSHHSLS